MRPLEGFTVVTLEHAIAAPFCTRQLADLGSPAGPLPARPPPGSWDDGDPVLAPVPALGEHTDTLLAGLGVAAAERAALRAAIAS